MNQIKTFFYFFFLLTLCSASFAQDSDVCYFENQPNLNTFDNSLDCLNETQEVFKKDTLKTDSFIKLDSTFQKNNSIIYPPLSKDYRRLGYNSALYFGAAIVTFGVLYSMPESFTHWDKQQMKEKGIFYKWKQNVKAGPVIDGDSFVINYVTHPYCGAIYYMTARSSGFNIFESFSYSAVMSTFFWEYGIEAFAEIPSIQDLIVTPIIGSAFGEGFFYMKKQIIKNDQKVLNSRFLGKTSLFFLDPFNTILDGFGYQQKVKTQTNIEPIGFNQFSNKPIWGLNFTASF